MKLRLQTEPVQTTKSFDSALALAQRFVAIYLHFDILAHSEACNFAPLPTKKEAFLIRELENIAGNDHIPARCASSIKQNLVKSDALMTSRGGPKHH